MSHDPYRMGFHIMPPVGWINDPNGCCQYEGVYHVFHQHSPHWPNDDAADRGWGHAWSRDLIHWQHEGQVIPSSIAEDSDGAWSGSALRIGNKLMLYYTGDVLEPGEHDYEQEGRQQNLLYIESADGFELGEKHVLMHNADYPDYCSLHVRDPYAWQQADPAGDYHLVLGARDTDGVGFAMVYDSPDGYRWEHRRDVRTANKLGFMWECPNRVALTDAEGEVHEFLAICPQGIPSSPDRWQHPDRAGYLPLPTALKDADTVDEQEFVEWDHGFDFYAPQMLVDEQGRTLLVGWMGNFSRRTPGALPGMSWCGCLTVPRLLTLAADGRILQNPAPELDQLHDGELAIEREGEATVVSAHDHRADVRFEGISGNFSLDFDGVMTFSFDGELAMLSFAEGAPEAAGRIECAHPTEAVTSLRVLVDSSCVEIYVNGGEQVFTSRWFPTASGLTLRLDAPVNSASAHHMADGMRETYEES